VFLHTWISRRAILKQRCQALYEELRSNSSYLNKTIVLNEEKYSSPYFFLVNSYISARDCGITDKLSEQSKSIIENCYAMLQFLNNYRLSLMTRESLTIRSIPRNEIEDEVIVAINEILPLIEEQCIKIYAWPWESINHKVGKAIKHFLRLNIEHQEGGKNIMIKNWQSFPIQASCILSIILLILSLFFESIVGPLGIMLIVIAIAFALYTVVALFVSKLAKWQLPITCAVLIFIGGYIIILSRFETVLDIIDWNPSMLGLGIAVIAFAFAFASQKTLKNIEETVNKINIKPEDLVTVIEEVETDVVAGSKESAQQRLDEDTKMVGYQRGQLHQNKDGKWGIHWELSVSESIKLSDK